MDLLGHAPYVMALDKCWIFVGIVAQLVAVGNVRLTIKPKLYGRKGYEIFDKIRLKYVSLTPEEWVRQHVLSHLTENLGYPKGLLGVEKEIRLN